MTTKEEIKTELNKAEARFGEAKKDLEEFMKKENLESFEKMWGMEELKRKMKKLEESKDKWETEVLECRRILHEGKGNEQIV